MHLLFRLPALMLPVAWCVIKWKGVYSSQYLTQGKFSLWLNIFQLDRSSAVRSQAKLCLLVWGSREKRGKAAVFDRVAPGGSDLWGEESGCLPGFCFIRRSCGRPWGKPSFFISLFLNVFDWGHLLEGAERVLFFFLCTCPGIIEKKQKAKFETIK